MESIDGVEKMHEEELEEVVFNLENMTDTSFSDSKGVPLPVANHSNVNYLKDPCEDFDNFLTQFFVISSQTTI